MTTQPAYLTLQSGTSRYLTQAAGTNYYFTLQDPAPYDNDVATMLAEAVWYIDAHDADYDGGQTVPNAGTAGTALNALLGGGTAVTTNDPKWLAYEGTPYAYLPGVASNYLSVPDEAALDVVSDVDIRVLCALDDWTPAALSVLVAKRAASNYSYQLHVAAATGYLTLSWTTDGSTAVTIPSTVAPTVTDGAALWVRAALDVDDGGVYKVYFYTSPADDGVSWTQLGTTVTGGSTTSIFSGNSTLEVGGRGGGQNPAAGKFYRAQIISDPFGTPTTVLDIDTSVLTSGSQTSFTATTGQTVSVSRSTSGRKATLVGGWAGGGSLWLLGSDDYLETPDSDLLDFGATDSFAVVIVMRQHAGWTAAQRVLYKKTTAGADAGYALYNTGTPYQLQGIVADGVDYALATGPTLSASVLRVSALVLDRAGNTVQLFANGTGMASASASAIGDTSSASVLRIGQASNGAALYADMEFTAAAIWRRALSAGEIAGLNQYFQNRAWNG